MNVKMYEFGEHNLCVRGEKHHLLELAEKLREADVEGSWADLVYQIEYEFDVDGIRSLDEHYTSSSSNGDYSPSNPWDAPGMSIRDFI